ncbi:hypothetical protein Tco_1494451, partial [Tanacetum coccineum]
MVRFKKKLQILKKEIRSWVNDCKKNQSGRLVDLRSKLCHIDKVIDQGGVNDDILLTRDEVRNAVWGCGENKSPGPDGFTFEFFRKFWDTLGSDFCAAVEWFFDHSSFSRGCNSSFIALILKNHDPKFVNDYRPISLIGSLYKHKKQQAMVFKVDFAKAYDSIRWDLLVDSGLFTL